MPDATQPPPKLKLKGRRKVQLARVLMGDSITEASRIAGYSGGNAGSRALIDTKSKLRATMDYYGLTEEKLIKDYLLPLMNATQTEFFAHKGKVMDERTVPDNGTRKDTMRIAFLLRGAFPKDQHDGPVSMNININNVSVANGE